METFCFGLGPKARTTVVAVLQFAAPACLGLDPAAIEPLVARAQAGIDAGDIPSCQLALARHGRIGFLATLGRATCQGRPVVPANDTLYAVFSCTKGLMAAAAWLLMQDGLLDPSRRVAELVPEFGTNGKDVVTIEQLYLHTCGFPSAPFSPLDWDYRLRRLERFARSRLEWEPGTRFALSPHLQHVGGGVITSRIALASSLNVPAVKTLSLVGIESFLNKLRQMGMKNLMGSGDFYGPSLALGSADISLWELTNGYRTLANEGVWSELRLLFKEDGPTQKKRVFSREASFLISDILSDREARSFTFDLENPLSTRFWRAVKTGTSKDMRDNWCIGYSAKYTVGVWTGNFSGEPMWNVSGVTGAAPLWIEVMNFLHRNDSSVKKEVPSGLVRREIKFPGLRCVLKEGNRGPCDDATDAVWTSQALTDTG